MDLGTTLISLAVVAAIFALCWFLERRPRSVGDVRMFPYIPVMMLCLVLILGLVAHLVGLLTGKPVGSQATGY
ncbi:hypothetical protein [Telmatospirillum sp.]|uniref:hypothetical protein n=1 Tax=Telmatospirillum sp. TaxID=2079197 RepID=UPI00283C4F83|nr:hypothetical protein [Telmatospirillum sp.]MDR3437542.1 hypothetical protein [Telmatospirillum sp.]